MASPLMAGGMTGGMGLMSGLASTNPWGLAALTALSMYGAHRQNKQQQAAADRKRKLAAETARYSPWTKMQADMNFEDPDRFGNAMKWGMTGAQMAQGMQKNKENKALTDSIMAVNKSNAASQKAMADAITASTANAAAQQAAQQQAAQHANYINSNSYDGGISAAGPDQTALVGQISGQNPSTYGPGFLSNIGKTTQPSPMMSNMSAQQFNQQPVGQAYQGGYLPRKDPLLAEELTPWNSMRKQYVTRY